MPRRTKWEDTRVDMLPANGGQTHISLMGTVTPNESEGETLVRTIGELGLFSTTVAGAYGVQRVDIGIGLASQEAFAAGVLPDPNTADEEPRGGWLYRYQCLVAQNGTGTNIIYHCRFDIGAMRKIDGDELYIIVNNGNLLAATFTVQVTGLVRCLIKLP